MSTSATGRVCTIFFRNNTKILALRADRTTYALSFRTVSVTTKTTSLIASATDKRRVSRPNMTDARTDVSDKLFDMRVTVTVTSVLLRKGGHNIKHAASHAVDCQNE